MIPTPSLFIVNLSKFSSKDGDKPEYALTSTNKGLSEIRKNKPKPTDWWHTPWHKIKGMYL